jgi:predicted ferric reductase/Ca2+-binding EF-hand superfamily protein
VTVSSTPERVLDVDRRLVAALERSFAAIAGDDRVLDLADLQRALGLRSEFLAKRMLAVLDRDGSGTVSRAEFLDAVRKIVFGSDDDKLRFAFALHDQDGDGVLGAEELLRMVAISLADADVLPRTSNLPESLTQSLFRAADKNLDGRISFDELKVALEAHPEVMRNMTRSEAQWIAPTVDLLGAEARVSATERPLRVARFFANRLSLALTIGIFFAANLAVLVGAFVHEMSIPFPDPWLSMGRATALCLTVNAALVFLPVLRRLMTRVRASMLGRLLPVDDAVALHRGLGHVIVVLSIVHAVCITTSYALGHGAERLVPFLTESEVGATGALLLAVLLVMWVFAFERVRRSKRFELFYVTHLGYVLWLGLALLHAPSFMVLGGLAALGLLIEQVLRIARRARPTYAHEVTALRSGVTRLALHKPDGFRFRAGDYVFVCVPSIARREWHPFTISSAPEADTIDVHVRSLGNWTSALRRLAEERERTGTTERLIVEIDGPYGSPTARIEGKPNVILVGAGIGVTPFASVLDSLQRRASDGAIDIPSAVHFFWLNRDAYSFEWFAALLARLEDHGSPPELTLSLHMTEAHRGASTLALELARHAAHREGARDVVTDLHTVTHFGAPQWESALREIVAQHPPGSVALFFCGPPGLGVRVRAACRAVGIPFHEERF